MATNIGVEPSEIMAAVAMLMPPAKLDTYSKSMKGIIDFMDQGEKIAESSKVVYSSGTKSKFLKAFNPSNPYFQTAALRGMSAAKSIRQWVPVRSVESGAPIAATAMPIKVFLTGDKWPSDISKYEVNAYGFKSYNSSDIVFQWKNPKGLSFYGVSLKIKPTPDSQDPTLINKAFDSVLEGKGEKEKAEFNKIKKELEQAKLKYFARVVREAAAEGYLKFPKGQSLPANDEALMKIKVDMPGFAKEAMFLINIKGKGFVDLKNPRNQPKTSKSIFQVQVGKEWREFHKGEMKDTKKSMRAFVNGKLGSKDSIYKVLILVLNKYSNLFARALLNLVLKSNLYKEIDENSFAFALVTGVGDLDSKGQPKPLQVVPAKGLYTVLCGLSSLNKSNTKYKMELDEEENRKSKEKDAAKVHINLLKGKLTVLDMQLRFKGNFSGQPQFTNTVLSPAFKDILKGQWGKKCKVF